MSYHRISIAVVSVLLCSVPASAEVKSYRLFTHEFWTTTYVTFDGGCRSGYQFYGPNASSFLVGYSYMAENFPNLRKNGDAWVPTTARRDPRPDNPFSYETSLSADGIITGEVHQRAEQFWGDFVYKWTLNLNTGAFHHDTYDAPGVPCPGRVVSDAIAPLLLKECPDSTVSYFDGWNWTVGACRDCSVTFNTNQVLLTSDGQGGSLQLDLANPTPNACQFIVASDAKVPLTYRDQTGAVVSGIWNLPPDSQTHVALSITGAVNSFCYHHVAGLFVQIRPGGATPRIVVDWDAQPSVFSPTTGQYICTPFRKLQPPNPSRFNPLGWGDLYSGERR